MAIKLYPPNIEGTIPAFYGTTLVVPFTMNRSVAKKEVSGFVIKIKTVQSGKFILTKQTSNFSYDPRGEVRFMLDEAEARLFSIGQYYKLQLEQL